MDTTAHPVMEPGADYVSAVRQLARHWCANPLACDCEDSIERWWMVNEENITRTQLHQALLWLEQCGAIESLRAGDGRVHYRRRHEFDAGRLWRIGNEPVADAPASHPRRY
jgi:hypothetical protein